MLERALPAWLGLCALALPSLAAERLEIRFSQQLGLADLRLAGQRATRRIDFEWPLDWRAQPGAELRLRFEHSAGLDGERSFLAVALNHGVLRSLRLEARNASSSELVVPLPPLMLREENQLVVSVEQFATEGAEEPWTLVSAESSMVIPFERRRTEPSLADLPEPLLRKRSYEARQLTVLVPTRPSLATVEATARSLASLAARVAPAPVRLAFARSIGEAQTPAIVVGTPREQPVLRDLGDLGEGAETASPDAGVVALLPKAGPSSLPVLVITGQGPGAVGQAALGLFEPRRKGSTVLLVSAVPERRVPAPREWRRFIPPLNGFPLYASGDERPELAVAADLPARIRLVAPPDARFLPYGHRATLVFETLPGLPSDPKAELEVYWNDVLLRQVSIEQAARGRTFTLSAAIPAAALKPQNVLTVAWNGRSGAPGPFVALRGDSTLFLPREYVAELPDLALLRSGFYPFSLRADLSQTVVGVTEADDAFPALCELAVLLGRLLPSDRFLLRVGTLSEAIASRDDDAILLEAGDAPGSLALPDVSRLPRAELLGRLPFVQELESPRGDGRHVLRLRGATPALLRAAVRSLGDPAVLGRLTGDTAFLSAEGPLAFRFAPPRLVTETSYLVRLEAWLRGHWLALPLILAAVSGLLFLGLRLVLGQRRAARRA